MVDLCPRPFDRRAVRAYADATLRERARADRRGELPVRLDVQQDDRPRLGDAVQLYFGARLARARALSRGRACAAGGREAAVPARAGDGADFRAVGFLQACAAVQGRE